MYVYIHMYAIGLYVVGLASPKFSEPAGGLEIQGRVDIVAHCQGRILSFSEEVSLFVLLKSSTD